MTVRSLSLCVLALAACGDESARGTDAGPGLSDADGDGYSPSQGDCDDSNPLVGPGSFEVPDNGIDDNCDGIVDGVVACDSGLGNQTSAAALAQAIGVCDDKFLTHAQLNGPSVVAGRNIVSQLGLADALEGSVMAFVSTGDAIAMNGYVPQPGTDLSAPGAPNSFPNPTFGQPPPPDNGCKPSDPMTVYDYTELELDLTVPANAGSFSYKSQFFSSEYPEFVCTPFNDRFLALLEDNGGAPQNVELDSEMNPVTVNNSFFTICQNDSAKPQTQNCKRPVTDIAGSGYDHLTSKGSPVGGSTGWLTTTVPATPGHKLKLRFIIFDEGDHAFDSAAIIDGFSWRTDKVNGPVTVQ